MESSQRYQQSARVIWIGLWLNAVLSMIKLAAGILGHSRAVVADAIHSVSDIVTDVVVLLGVKTGNKPEDETHHYGHGKFETVSAFFLGIFLVIVGVGICLSGIKTLGVFYRHGNLPRPGWIAFYAAFVSILVKEGLFHYTLKVGKNCNSDAIIANAWHHRSDAFSSIGTTLGVLGAIVLGEKWRILDPIAALIVSALIIKIGITIFIDSINELLEKSLDPKTEDRILQVIAATDGVINPHRLRTRKIGDRIAIDIHIEVEKEKNVVQAHAIATMVENNLRESFGKGSFVSVHIEPANYRDESGESR
jgi:cation diffusion facilitator family transporter